MVGLGFELRSQLDSKAGPFRCISREYAALFATDHQVLEDDMMQQWKEDINVVKFFFSFLFFFGHATSGIYFLPRGGTCTSCVERVEF